MMTILTECPSCDAPHMFEMSEYRGGWTPIKCDECGAVMWVQETRLPGMTYGSEDFFAKIVQPGDEAEVRAAEAACLNGTD